MSITDVDSAAKNPRVRLRVHQYSELLDQQLSDPRSTGTVAELWEHLAHYFGKQYGFRALLRCLLTPPSLTTIRVNTDRCGGSMETAKQMLAERTGCSEWRTLECVPELLMNNVVGPLQDCLKWSLEHEGVDGGNFIVVDHRTGESLLRGADVYAPGVICGNFSSGKLHVGEKVMVFCALGLDTPTAATDNNNRQRISLHRSDKLAGVELVWSGDGMEQAENCNVVEHDVCLLAQGTLMMTHQQIFHSERSGLAVHITQRIFNTVSFESLNRPGEIEPFFAQNLPSMITSRLLDPQPGQRVLDMCSAPGGKATHLAMLMKNQGNIIALDRNRTKVAQVKALAKSQGLTIVHAMLHDATKLIKKRTFEKESFDSILVDAPCSGFGIRPNLRLAVQGAIHSGHALPTLGTIQHVAGYQRRILKEALALLKPGGHLVFSTCSITPDENEMNVKWLLDGGEVELCDLPAEFAHGRFPFAVCGLRTVLDETQSSQVLRFDPIHHNGVTGFFCAKFKKKGLTMNNGEQFNSI